MPGFNTDINVAFQKGHKLAPGGKREGAGRPGDWLRKYTQRIVKRDKLIARLALIARGGDIPQPLNNGEVVPIPAPVAEQRKAILDLLERGYGKVTQPLEHSGEIGKTVWLLPDGFKNPQQQKRD